MNKYLKYTLIFSAVATVISWGYSVYATRVFLKIIDNKKED